MFVRLYHGIRLMRDRSSVYRRRHMIIICRFFYHSNFLSKPPEYHAFSISLSSRLLRPADFDWWTAFKIVVDRYPTAVCVLVGVGGVFMYAIALFSAEW